MTLTGAGFLRPGDQGRGEGRPAAGVQHQRLQGLQREGALRVPQLPQDLPPEAARDSPQGPNSIDKVSVCVTD